MRDKPTYVTFDPNNPTQAYTWGSNSNFNLGHGRQRSREQPELVDSLVLGNHSIKQVSLIRQYLWNLRIESSMDSPMNHIIGCKIMKILLAIVVLLRKIGVHYIAQNLMTITTLLFRRSHASCILWIVRRKQFQELCGSLPHKSCVSWINEFHNLKMLDVTNYIYEYIFMCSLRMFSF